MTTQHKPGTASSGLSEEAVAYYLETHPEFFERHSSLLTSMSLSHLNSGSAVSLIERQVELLRERNHKIERKLADFVETARGNDVLAEKIHRLGLGLLRADSMESCLKVVETSLREDFTSDQSVLILIQEDKPELEALANAGRFMKVASSQSPDVKGFDSLVDFIFEGWFRWSHRDGAAIVVSALIVISEGMKRILIQHLPIVF